MADTDLTQLVINVGTKAQIDAGIAGGTITENMLSVSTDGDTYIQGVKVNGTELTPDSNNKVNVTVPTDTGDLTNNAGFITGITSAMVTTALGYTPYNSSNPSGYQANVLEGVQLNGTDLAITNKKVNLAIEEYTAQEVETLWGSL